jgi:hypothetical protein
METNPTPFDLNRAVQQWRENLGDSPALRRENLDELETHLRDSIANLKNRGLAEDEAFLIATRRLGGKALLGREFGKVNSQAVWLNRALWMLVGIQLHACVGSFVHTITYGTAALIVMPVANAIGLKSSPVLAGVVFGTIHLLAFSAALAAAWWLVFRRTNRISMWCRSTINHRRGFTGFVVGCGILWLVPPVALIAVQALTIRYISPANAGKFYMGLNYGPYLASWIEGAVLVLLTLLFARQQWFAKTRA